MQISPISKTKTGQVKLPKSVADKIKDYTKYLTETTKTHYQIDDILASLLLDEKTLEKVPKETPDPIEKISLKMPEKSWKNLEAICKKSNQDKEKVLIKVSENLLKDKKFSNWLKSKQTKK